MDTLKVLITPGSKKETLVRNESILRNSNDNRQNQATLLKELIDRFELADQDGNGELSSRELDTFASKSFDPYYVRPQYVIGQDQIKLLEFLKRGVELTPGCTENNLRKQYQPSLTNNSFDATSVFNRLLSVFSFLDKDQDGKLSEQELDVFAEIKNGKERYFVTRGKLEDLLREDSIRYIVENTRDGNIVRTSDGDEFEKIRFLLTYREIYTDSRIRGRITNKLTQQAILQYIAQLDLYHGQADELNNKSPKEFKMDKVGIYELGIDMLGLKKEEVDVIINEAQAESNRKLNQVPIYTRTKAAWNRFWTNF